jgi:hypothetical protein
MFSLTSVADSSVVYFNSNFVGTRRLDLNIFDGEVFSSFPSYCGLIMIINMSFIQDHQLYTHFAGDCLEYGC